MDNEHIIKEFRSYVDGFVECCTSDHETHELLKAVDKLIEEQEERIAIMSEGGWHDAKTDPPKKDGDYFALHDEDVVEIWECCDGEFGYGKDEDWISSKDCGIEITHWMNIPAPPKEGEPG